MKNSKGKAPKGKHIFGTVKIGEKGQIVIPKAARELFDLKPGDSLVVLGDEKKQGLALIKNDLIMQTLAKHIEIPIIDDEEDEE